MKVRFLRSRFHYDVLFYDIEFLRELKEKIDDEEEQPLPYHLNTASELVILSSREMIGEAKNAVKAGTADYITYPIKSTEVKHLIGRIYGDNADRSALDYRREPFWQADLLELTRTRNPEMKVVFEKVRLKKIIRR